ncbi:MAG TPA: peptidase, partial [Roseivirga sp.]
NSNVLGVSHRNTSMVIFQKRIEELSGGVGQVSTSLLTSSVMGHEFAHILGLVNIGSPMQNAHQDDANGAHCDNQDCLMYFAVENSSGLSDLLGMSSPPPLDANCLADLSANGGK